MRIVTEYAPTPDTYEKPREACGVFGILYPEGDYPVGALTAAGLAELQHRGQDGAGVYVSGGQEDSMYPFVGTKGLGLVGEAVPNVAMLDHRMPQARIGIGHTRYGTSHAATDQFETVQPFRVGNFALAHNGHILNVDSVAEQYGLSPDVYDSDSHTLAAVLAHVAGQSNDGLEKAMAEVFPQLYGAYSLVIAQEDRVYGVRDPVGLRPLMLGATHSGDGLVLASEEPALRAVDATRLRDVGPGEIVRIDGNDISSSFIEAQADRRLCALEFVYFSRPDGRLEGASVSEARWRMGARLAEEHPAEADIVLGVPESGNIAAAGYADRARIRYTQHGLTRSSYVTRSFIQADQDSRRRAVKAKLRPDSTVIEGQRVVVVDDSIVRGTTMTTLIGMLREAGAAEVHLRLTYPPLKWPCFFGIDIGNPDQLLANGHGTEEMNAILGADSLGFISPEGLEHAINLPLGSLCMACATGDYPKSTASQHVDLPMPTVRA